MYKCELIREMAWNLVFKWALTIMNHGATLGGGGLRSMQAFEKAQPVLNNGWE